MFDLFTLLVLIVMFIVLVLLNIRTLKTKDLVDYNTQRLNIFDGDIEKATQYLRGANDHIEAEIYEPPRLTMKEEAVILDALGWRLVYIDGMSDEFVVSTPDNRHVIFKMSDFEPHGIYQDRIYYYLVRGAKAVCDDAVAMTGGLFV